MSVLKITSENYEEEVLNSKEKVLIDFYADWCGPCKMMAPVVEEIANELEGKLKVGKVNVDENQDLAIKYGIMSIPTLVVIENGETVRTLVGFRSKQELLEILDLKLFGTGQKSFTRGRFGSVPKNPYLLEVRN